MPRDVATQVPQGVPDTASRTKPTSKVVHTEDAKMQVWFQNAISTELNIPDGYLKASALIIKWHKNLDQFSGHDEEVSDHLPELRLNIDRLIWHRLQNSRPYSKAALIMMSRFLP
jgi:hypothetical protein